MIAHLDQHLIALAAAVGDDGGQGVLRVLRDVLRTHAPFEAGEVAFAESAPGGVRRLSLTDDTQELVAEDLLLDLGSRPELRRFDEPGEFDVFPRTRASLAARGIASLLVLPLSQAGGAKGAIVLARCHAWGFVGAPLRVLVPVAAMAGLAFEWARGAARRERAPDGRAETWPPVETQAAAEAESTILSLRSELERQHALEADLTDQRDAALRQVDALRAELARMSPSGRRRRR